jgi:hypothetical protein
MKDEWKTTLVQSARGTEGMPIVAEPPLRVRGSGHEWRMFDLVAEPPRFGELELPVNRGLRRRNVVTMNKVPPGRRDLRGSMPTPAVGMFGVFPRFHHARGKREHGTLHFRHRKTMRPIAPMPRGMNAEGSGTGVQRMACPPELSQPYPTILPCASIDIA